MKKRLNHKFLRFKRAAKAKGKITDKGRASAINLSVAMLEVIRSGSLKRRFQLARPIKLDSLGLVISNSINEKIKEAIMGIKVKAKKPIIQGSKKRSPQRR